MQKKLAGEMKCMDDRGNASQGNNLRKSRRLPFAYSVTCIGKSPDEYIVFYAHTLLTKRDIIRDQPNMYISSFLGNTYSYMSYQI